MSGQEQNIGHYPFPETLALFRLPVFVCMFRSLGFKCQKPNSNRLTFLKKKEVICCGHGAQWSWGRSFISDFLDNEGVTLHDHTVLRAKAGSMPDPGHMVRAERMNE